MKISELTPTDFPRKESLEFFSSLNHEEVRKINPLPQVWDFNGKFFLSDGNNRTTYYIKKGIHELEVDY